MIPSGNLLTAEYTEESIPTRTWLIDEKQNRIVGKCDRLQAVMQAVRLILSTERWQYLILPQGYGVQLNELIGAAEAFVRADIKRRIEEALQFDERIEGLTDCSLTSEGDSLLFTATVVTIYGLSPIELPIGK